MGREDDPGRFAVRLEARMRAGASAEASLAKRADEPVDEEGHRWVELGVASGLIGRILSAMR